MQRTWDQARPQNRRVIFILRLAASGREVPTQIMSSVKLTVHISDLIYSKKNDLKLNIMRCFSVSSSCFISHLTTQTSTLTSDLILRRRMEVVQLISLRSMRNVDLCCHLQALIAQTLPLNCHNCLTCLTTRQTPQKMDVLV